MIAVRCLLETALLIGFQSVVAHQTGRAMATYGQTVLPQINMHAGASIGPVRRRETRRNMGKKDYVVQLTLAGAATPPSVVAADTDIQQRAHPVY